MHYVASTCPFCGCGCGLYLCSSDNQLTGVAPSINHAVAHGRLCNRGWAAHEATLWGRRMTTPMMRRNGRLEPVTWDDALRAAEHTLRRLRDHGSIVGVLGSGRATDQENFLATTLARSGLRTGNVDTLPAGSWSALASAMKSAPTDAEAEVEQADLLLAIEGDLAQTHPVLASSVLRALRHGAKLVTIGWAPSRMSEVADAHLRLPARAPLSAFADLKAALVAPRLGEGNGKPADDVATTANTVARWLADAQRTVILFGAFDADTKLIHETAEALRTLTLYIRAAGGAIPVVVPLAPRANTRGAFEMGVTPDHLPGAKPLDDAATRATLQRLWGDAPSWSKGITAQEFVHHAAGLVVIADDLIAHSDAPTQMRETLEKLETLIVIDAFMTPTALAAHIAFPSPAFGEADGTFTSLDGRRQPVQRIMESPAEARPGWAILAQIAASLGSSFEPGHVGNVNDAIERVLPNGPSSDLTGVRQPTMSLDDIRATETVPSKPLLLRMEGAFDWSLDPLHDFSPTLRRISASDRKLNPHGVVSVSTEDANVWHLREGATLHVRSAHGDAAPSVHVRAGQEQGVLFVPYAFRDELREVLAGEYAVDVEVVRT